MKKRVNYIKVNLNKKNNHLNKNNTNGITYIGVKEKNNSYLERNKNIRLLKENSTLRKINNGDYLEERQSNNKEGKIKNISLLSFVPKQKINSNKKEELKKLQRNAVSMRRLEYSMKIKDVSSKKRYKFNKYNIQKVITIQKWVKGYLLRSFLCNVCECEQIMNDFINHINKYIFIKSNIFHILKNINTIKNINDNICLGRKLSGYNNDNISISIINTNNNTNTFTNNNTFSLCQDTPDNFETGNRKLKVIQNRNYHSPSLRELLMVNCDKSKNNKYNNINEINNQNKLSSLNSKNFKRAKSLNDIKNINQQQIIKNNSNNILIYSSLKSNLKNKVPIQIKEIKQNNIISIKTSNLRFLLFNNNSKKDEPLNKYYRKPINNIMFITKISLYNNNNINLEEENINDIENENNEEYNEMERNGLFGLENIIIEEIKEAKEDEEEDSQSQIEINKISSFLDNGIIDSSREVKNGSIVPHSQKEKRNNNFKIKTFNISSISFQIKSNNYDKGKIFFILLLQKQIMFIIKPYVFNLLKQNWKKKLTS